MVDDFHGTEDWENFMTGMRQVLPDRPIEDLQSGDEIFHTLYDVDDKMQILGEQFIRTGRTYDKDGYQPKWRAIRDDKGRIIVAICHNMHLGDAWEWLFCKVDCSQDCRSVSRPVCMLWTLVSGKRPTSISSRAAQRLISVTG